MPFFFYTTEDLLGLSKVDGNLQSAMSTKKLSNDLRIISFKAIDTPGTWSALKASIQQEKYKKTMPMSIIRLYEEITAQYAAKRQWYSTGWKRKKKIVEEKCDV